MHTTISAASLLALVSAVAAQTAGFDAITTPAKDEAVAACSSYVINWDYVSTYAGTVSIQLLEGATSTTLQLGPVIASGIDNSLGQYTWAVDCGLGDDATYGIKIIYDNDSTGVTFQYSNPFQITKAATTSSSSSSTVAPTTAAAVTTAAAAAAGEGATGEEASTVYATEWMTITSCAATVTDCPARSTVVSSTVKPVVVTGSSSAPAAPVVSSAASSSFSSVSPVMTGAPIYPAGNSTGSGAPGVGAGGLGTVTLPKTATTTGSGSASTSSSVVTAGAGRVAAGGVAAVAGLVAAVFAL